MSPLARFTHQRIREYPISGGPSTLRESIADPLVEKMAEKILRALDWFGVAMVEFRYDPRDGLPKLMEINPRFWGSLPLAVYAGVDFPYWLFCLAMDWPIPEAREYPLGKRCRWILPGDLLHFFKNPKRFQMTPSFFRFFDKNTAHDFFSWSDPGPALGRVMTLFTLLYDRDMKTAAERSNPLRNLGPDSKSGLLLENPFAETRRPYQIWRRTHPTG